jgi:hypothetical protein
MPWPYAGRGHLRGTGRPAPTACAGLLASTLADLEKVRTQFLSLRHLTQGRIFSGRTREQLSPVAVAISKLSAGLPVTKSTALFSEWSVSLRTSRLSSFATVPEIRSFSATYESLRKPVRPFLSDRQKAAKSNAGIAKISLDVGVKVLTDRTGLDQFCINLRGHIEVLVYTSVGEQHL